MPRLLGVDIPDNKNIVYSLTYIKGIGLSSARDIVDRLGLDATLKAKDLTEEEINKISAFIDKEYVIEGELVRQVKDNIKRLKDIGTYRGNRHKVNLPVRGQKTRCNARTRKGPRQTVGGVSVRKVVSKT